MLDKFFEWLAWKLPKRLAYWTVIRVVTHVSTTSLSYKEMGAITALEAVQEWKDAECG